MSNAADSLPARIERLESLHAIQQLAIRYAIAVDSRDLDAWVSLFVDDVNCGSHGKGRDALRGFIAPLLRDFYRSIHLICGHEIDLTGPDTARGKVYCRAEHEDDTQWIVMAICYFDSYTRRDGNWYFVRRNERHWYAADTRDHPMHPQTPWPPAAGRPAALPHAFASWTPFWAHTDPAIVQRLTRQPV
ncbi:MAG TPA: nuclear transport factor 2 family protein [Acetobacteraceae bacterium]|nr:nuclear transport factor 2 family protein [Acetobacteraceae bacterium]